MIYKKELYQTNKKKTNKDMNGWSVFLISVSNDKVRHI